MNTRQYLSLKKPETCFTLALLAHILALLSYTLVIIFPHKQPDVDETAIYLPAYVYHEQSAATPSRPTIQSTLITKNMPKADLALKKTEQQPSKNTEQGRTQTELSERIQPQPNLFLNQNRSPYSQAPNFVKNKNVSKPLLRLLTAATAAHFTYPAIAQDFRMTGTTRIRFLLHPNGEVTNVTVVQSSGASVLDESALTTIKSISPVGDVSTYISEPQFIEANLIFA